MYTNALLVLHIFFIPLMPWTTSYYYNKVKAHYIYTITNNDDDNILCNHTFGVLIWLPLCFRYCHFTFNLKIVLDNDAIWVVIVWTYFFCIYVCSELVINMQQTNSTWTTYSKTKTARLNYPIIRLFITLYSASSVVVVDEQTYIA